MSHIHHGDASARQLARQVDSAAALRLRVILLSFLALASALPRALGAAASSTATRRRGNSLAGLTLRLPQA